MAGYGRFQEEMKWNVLNVEMKRWFWQRFLMKNMGTLAYVNNESDLMYLLYQSTVYSIDLSSGEKSQLARNSI